MATKVVAKTRSATSALRPEVQNTPHDVETTLKYYDDPGDGTPPTPVVIGGGTVTNKRKMLQKQVTVQDITGREADFTLDSCGFQHHQQESRTSCLDDAYRDEARIVGEYLPECEQLIQGVTGASRVVAFDHKVRRGPTDWHQLGPGNSAFRGGLHRVHVDQSYAGAEMILRHSLPGEADELLRKKRWQIINLWRPINQVFKDPLAVADSTTVDDEDLVAAKTVYSDHQRETWTVKHGPAHRWYFKYAQRPDEVMLIKCFDTVTDVARRSPHSAFVDEEHAGMPPRESIEVRSFVFFD